MSETSDDRSDLELWRKGDQAAARKLFERYVDRVVNLARRHLSKPLAGRVDAEDIAQSVFRTFFHRASQGQFHIEESEDLCKLLTRITVHKTFRQIAFHKRAKRDAGAETGANQEILVNQLASGPTPDEAVAFIDQLDRFLEQFKPVDRQIIEMRLEGHSNVDISKKLGVSDRKIRRLMERIRGQAEQADLIE